MAEKKHDLDLGDGHWLDWTNYEGERCGGNISHTKSAELLARQRIEADVPEAIDERCLGAFWIKGNKFGQKYLREGRAEWNMTGTFECPTLSPSFLCHCGDHGFVREGKWVRA